MIHGYQEIIITRLRKPADRALGRYRPVWFTTGKKKERRFRELATLNVEHEWRSRDWDVNR